MGLPDDDDSRTFVDTDLRNSRFVGCDLSGAVMRGIDIGGADIDAPWLSEDHGTLHVNGVDVAPFVESELNRRFPGRSERFADHPDGLRSAWDALQCTWTDSIVRVAAMPAGTVDVSVDGEFSFAQTLRHLIMATDIWLRKAILGIEHPLHPLGQPNVEYLTDGYDPGVFSTSAPAYGAVLDVRAERVDMVRMFLATVTAVDLAVPRTNPWAPDRTATTLSCLHTILGEEWEHHRFAVRDLDAIAAASTCQRTALPRNH